MNIEKTAIRQATWLKSYAVGCWALVVVIAVGGLVSGVLDLLSDEVGGALMAWVCAAALAAIHVIVGKGLWEMRNWARLAALQMHGLMLTYMLLWVIVSLTDLSLPYLDRVLSMPVLLALIGGLAVWVGVRAEEGERLAVYGPDPDSVALAIHEAPVKIVNAPVDPAIYPRRARTPPVIRIVHMQPKDNTAPPVEAEEEDGELIKSDLMQVGLMMLVGSAIYNFINGRRDDDDKGDGGLVDIIKSLMDGD